MGMKQTLLALMSACVTALAALNFAHADNGPVKAQAASAPVSGMDAEDAAVRAQRWKSLQQAFFAGREVGDGSALLKLEAPPRALDAALVPVTIQLTGAKPVKGLYLIIDNNPGPLAGHFTFGPKADPRSIKTRVRVNEYTLIHAVAETQDGKLHAVEKFVKAAGGCSAPAGADEAEAIQAMGRMKLKLLDPFVAGKPMQAQLMVRHPNFNGMQMNQITRNYTPARFIKHLEVTYDGGSVFQLDSDISLSTDPVITFGFVPQAKGQLKVHVRDSKDGEFAQSFEVPAAAAQTS